MISHVFWLHSSHINDMVTGGKLPWNLWCSSWGHSQVFLGFHRWSCWALEPEIIDVRMSKEKGDQSKGIGCVEEVESALHAAPKVHYLLTPSEMCPATVAYILFIWPDITWRACSLKCHTWCWYMNIPWEQHTVVQTLPLCFVFCLTPNEIWDVHVFTYLLGTWTLNMSTWQGSHHWWWLSNLSSPCTLYWRR